MILRKKNFVDADIFVNTNLRILSETIETYINKKIPTKDPEELENKLKELEKEFNSVIKKLGDAEKNVKEKQKKLQKKEDSFNIVVESEGKKSRQFNFNSNRVDKCGQRKIAKYKS